MSVPGNTRAGALQQVMATFRTALLAQDVVAQRAILEGLATVNDRLRTLAGDLQAEIDALGPDAQFWQVERLARYNELLDQIDTEVQSFAQTLGSQLPVAQAAAAQVGAAAALAQARAIAGTARIGARWNQLSAPALREIVASTQAGPLADLLGAFGPDAAAKARAVLVEGIGTGQNARVVGRALEAATGTTRQRAQVIARTEILRAGKSANLQSFAANSDLISGWQWDASKGPRTCSACLIMDGTEFPTTVTFFPGHPQCRCAAIPVLRDYPTPKQQTGREYLESLPEDEQRRLLGNRKYEAWKSGELELDDMVAPRYSEQWGTSYQEASLATAEANAAVRRAGGISGTPTPTATPAPVTVAPATPKPLLQSSGVQRGPNSPDWVGKYEYPTPDADLSPAMLDARYRIAAGEDPEQFTEVARQEIFQRSGIDSSIFEQSRDAQEKAAYLQNEIADRYKKFSEIDAQCALGANIPECAPDVLAQLSSELTEFRDNAWNEINKLRNLQSQAERTPLPQADITLSVIQDLRPDYGQSAEALTFTEFTGRQEARDFQKSKEVLQSVKKYYPKDVWDELAAYTQNRQTQTAIVDRGFARTTGDVLCIGGNGPGHESIGDLSMTAIHELWHFTQQRFPLETSLKENEFLFFRRLPNESLSSIYQGSSEVGIKDKFYNHYCGKVYFDYGGMLQYYEKDGNLSGYVQLKTNAGIVPAIDGNEIGSMGIEQMFVFNDALPRAYSRSFWGDSEYVNFMLRLLISL